jgi:hypothetical protein
MISCLDFFLSDEPLVRSEVVHNEGLMHNSGHYDILSTFCIPDFCKVFLYKSLFLWKGIFDFKYYKLTIGLQT